MLRWFQQPISLARVYTGLVPVSGRSGVFSPSHFTIWQLQRGGFELETGEKTVCLKAPNWVLLPPIPRRQHAFPETQLFSVHYKIDASGLARLDWPAVLLVNRENVLPALEVARERLLWA